MLFQRFQLRTSLLILVLFLSVLTLAAIAVGWYGQQDVISQLASAGDIKSGVNAAVVQSIESSRYVFIGLIVAAIIVGFWAYITLSRALVRPLEEAGSYFDLMAAGDLTQRIDVSSDNEIGVLYLALKRLQDSLGRIVGTVRYGMNEIHEPDRSTSWRAMPI